MSGFSAQGMVLVNPFLRFTKTTDFLLKSPVFKGNPKGPKIEKIQDRPPGLKFSIEIENFKRATQ